MNYTPSRPGDVALHAKHHAQAATVLDISNQFLRAAGENTVWTSESNSDMIVVITAREEPYKKKAAEKILEVVEKELGGVGIPVGQLWSRIERLSSTGQASKYDRYRVYLYLRDRTCMGALLAERIFAARRVRPNKDGGSKGTFNDNGNTNTSLAAGEESDPAILGISRIWSSKLARRAGIGTQLLDVARQNFQPLMHINKDMVAFSQPTESGAKLARKWFGKESGWHVYAD
jgi:N-acetyltransferase